MMKYKERLIYYAGVILMGIGIMLAPPSYLTSGLMTGAASYLFLSIFYWLIFRVLLGKFWGDQDASRIDLAKLRLLLIGLGIGALATGSLLRNSTAIDTGFFLLLVALELYATKNEVIRDRKAS